MAAQRISEARNLQSDYPSVRILSVRLSYTRKSRLNGSRYLNMLCTTQCFSFLKPNFAILNLGVHPERVRCQQRKFDKHYYTSQDIRCESARYDVIIH